MADATIRADLATAELEFLEREKEKIIIAKQLADVKSMAAIEEIRNKEALSRIPVDVKPAIDIGFSRPKLELNKMLPRWLKGGDKIALDNYLQKLAEVCTQCSYTDDAIRATLFVANADQELIKVLNDLKSIVSSSYEKICEVLRSYYRLTPEDYRVKFRSVKKSADETFAQFSGCLGGSFDRWMTATKSTTFENMREVVIMEAFLQGTDRALANHIFDKEPETVDEAARCADNFISRRTARDQIFNKPEYKKTDNQKQSNKFSRNRTFNGKPSQSKNGNVLTEKPSVPNGNNDKEVVRNLNTQGLTGEA
jgi:hypothetical protein